MTAQQLTAVLKSTNNGYLFAPHAAELHCARENPELFTVTAKGTIAPRGFVFEQHQLPAVQTPCNYDEFDYEGAILARQRIDY